MDGAGSRRTIGLILVVSAFVLTLLSILFGTGAIPVSEGAYIPLQVALGAAAMVDLILGVVFLRRGD